MSYTNPETCPECGTTYTNTTEAKYISRNHICLTCARKKNPSKGQFYGGFGGSGKTKTGAQSPAYAYWDGLLR